MVMIFHAAQLLLPRPGLAALGQTGVDLFFVLSGFLITSILLGSPQDDWGEVRTFYVRRALRILPLYYAYLLMVVLFHRPVGWPYWIYLQNFWVWSVHPIAGPEHFWSLAVEEQFYLVWPFLVLFAPRRLLVPILWVLIVAAGMFRLALFGREDIYALTFTRMDGLAAGGVLAVYFGRRSLARYRGWLVAGLVLLTAISGVLAVDFGRRRLLWFAVVKYWALSGMFAFLLAVILITPMWRGWAALRWRPLRWVGRISYGLYVFHPAVFRVTYRMLGSRPAWLRCVAGVVFAFGISALSWYLYERNFIRLKDWLVPERRVVPETPVTV
jgi:peptidoglycan/LPS O-acetylase OafA/YrhL